MTDLYILFAKIRSLSKRRIAEVDDFVDFLARRGAVRKIKPPPTLWEKMKAIEERNRARQGDPPLAET